MSIAEWSEDVLLVKLSPESTELKTVIGMVRDCNNIDIVLDFSEVAIFSSSSLYQMLKLRELLVGFNRRLVLCSVKMGIKWLFTIRGLDDFLEIVDDKFAVLVVGLMMMP